MTVKDRVHQLVEALPPSELHAAARYLEYLASMGDPLLRLLLAAPLDDEPETEEERAAVAEAYGDLKAGHVHSLDDVKRELGL